MEKVKRLSSKLHFMLLVIICSLFAVSCKLSYDDILFGTYRGEINEIVSNESFSGTLSHSFLLNVISKSKYELTIHSEFEGTHIRSSRIVKRTGLYRIYQPKTEYRTRMIQLLGAQNITMEMEGLFWNSSFPKYNGEWKRFDSRNWDQTNADGIFENKTIFMNTYGCTSDTIIQDSDDGNFKIIKFPIIEAK